MPPSATSEDVATVAKEGVAFALALKAALQAPGNQFLSPYSIATALGLLQLGARGATAQEISKALGLSLTSERAHAAFAGLQANLLDQTGAELSAHSALWPSAKIALDEGYTASARRFYGAPPEPIDFGDAEEAARRINLVVEQGTRGYIRNLLSARMLPPSTRLVLTSAVYFKGKWTEPFKAAATLDQTFSCSDGSITRVPLMRSTRSVSYLEDESMQAVELAYKGGRFKMAIFLPRQKRGLPAFERSLTADALNGILGRLAPRELEIFLPRFRLETTLNLNPALAELGMPGAFDDSADFSGISAKQPIKVSAAVHKAFVDVAEEGTEAAAATAFTATLGELPPAAPHLIFRADHPFLFLIRDVLTGAILFLGRLEDPREAR